MTIGITSDRRSDDLIATFTRHGAAVVHAPTLRIVPLEEDTALLADTRAVIDDPPEILLATTGIGMRAWIGAADAAGLGQDLVRALAGARVLARRPKAKGALRAAGLSEDWTAASEQTAEAIEYLVSGQAVGDLEGRSVLVQLHGAASVDELAPLVRAGAILRTVAVYRWTSPEDPTAVDCLVEAIAARTVDAVTFTSAPGAVALLEAARRRGQLPAVVAACSPPPDGVPSAAERPVHPDVVACAVGDVTALPLRAAGIEPLVPSRWRLGALSRAVGAHLAQTPRHRVGTSHGELVVRARAAVLDGVLLDLTPAALGVLTQLAAAGGGVVEAAEAAVDQLRAGLPDDSLVSAVGVQGYRLSMPD